MLGMNYQNIQSGLSTAFLDKNISSNVLYRPQFISNDYKNGRKVLSTIEDELLHCDSFLISVAFITMGGITPLLQTLRTLEDKGIKGKILTTDYLAFSDPKALDKLATFSNIELKMYLVPDSKNGFHTKGYIFQSNEIYKILIGSSNMTNTALTTNREWNTKIVSTKSGEFVSEMLDEFEELWNHPNTYSYNEFIGAYRVHYEEYKKVKQKEEIKLPSKQLIPNSMQHAFISSLRNIRNSNESKALLISATGTGKTYASAFALQDQNPKKALFLVHREQIAKQALQSYRNVFGDTKTLGLLSGNSKDINVDYLFATMQTMSKKEVYSSFAPDTFDTIIIDEAHRIGAKSYQEIMDYFKPKFWLGMSASPERTDDFDVYAAFDHNIAYEIRLQQALEENLLCPFHYFGITDFLTDGNETDFTDFNYLTSNQRVDYIIKQTNYYGYSGERVKGLMFCSSKKEAAVLSERLNLRGYRTLALSGEDSQEKREDAIDRLVSNTRSDYLQYILTVDIFNEGVDIPEINQVVLLRPTQSPIVFVQQLGRGLRKSQDKEYVVILDFIGNYKNNFMIPIALSGDRSYNKDNIRRYVLEGERIIPGSSTIHFDEISKKQIFASIDKLSGIKTFIKESYKNLKYKLNRTPLLMDFLSNHEVDPLVILKEYKTYYKLLESIDASSIEKPLNDKELTVLEYYSSIIANSRRPIEAELLNQIINLYTIEPFDLLNQINSKYNTQFNMNHLNSALSNITGNFIKTSAEKDKYTLLNSVILHNDDKLSISNDFKNILTNTQFKEYIQDLIDVCIEKNKSLRNKKKDTFGFIMYEKYSRRDVCQLLNHIKDDASTMYGMKQLNKNTCIFVTYHKADGINGAEYLDGKPNYSDSFMDSQTFMWNSKIGNGPESKYMKEFTSGETKRLFVKKSDGEGTDFYYMGTFEIDNIKGTTKKNNKGVLQPICDVTLKMNESIREDIFDYLQQ
jgi:superfamily II DNA or RNA helicase/HKD family nuclease